MSRSENLPAENQIISLLIKMGTMYQDVPDVHGYGRGRRHWCRCARHHASDCVLLQVRAYARGEVRLRSRDC